MSPDRDEAPGSSAPHYLFEAAALWRGMDEQLTRMRLMLEEEGDEAVPSYRVGSAEGSTVFRDLGASGKIVEESLREMQTELIRRREYDDETGIAKLAESLRDLLDGPDREPGASMGDE